MLATFVESIALKIQGPLDTVNSLIIFKSHFKNYCTYGNDMKNVILLLTIPSLILLDIFFTRFEVFF
jgi:hypothetical protein